MPRFRPLCLMAPGRQGLPRKWAMATKEAVRGRCSQYGFGPGEYSLQAEWQHLRRFLDERGAILVERSRHLEGGGLSDRPHVGSFWLARRYTSIPVSDEPEAQIARLRYLLANSAKEGLVLSPLDWPGVHCAKALMRGTPLQGVWIDRTAFHEARKRGDDAKLSDFEEELELHFQPLPCWSHLDEGAWRDEVAELVRDIEAETLDMHRQNGTVPLGATAVLRAHQHQRPGRENRSPKPRFHARLKIVREAMEAAYAAFVESYAAAASRLRQGDSRPRFPPNCFPPGLPFVPPWQAACGFT